MSRLQLQTASEMDSLPNEVVFHILRFLRAQDLAKMAQTCKRLQELTRMDILWHSLCIREYHFESREGWGDNITYSDIYSKVLFPYGTCQGLWRSSVSPYGLLVHVKLECGKFSARWCKFPRTENADDPLHWTTPIFSLTLKDMECQVLCRKDCPSSGIQLKITEGHLHYNCSRCLEMIQPLSEEKLFSQWVEETRPDLDTGRPDLIYKGFSVAKVTKLWSSYMLDKIPPAVQSAISPITLGMYKGTYGSHGIEIIHVTMAENGYEILGDKILGDPNVPAGKISLYIDLRRPVSLNEDQQDFSIVNDLDPETLSSPYRFPPGSSQPFFLSEEVFMRNVQNLPTTCKARYAGNGQIAAHGYINPEKCRGHFVVFSEDYFGFLWLDLTSFSVFRLAEKDFI